VLRLPPPLGIEKLFGTLFKESDDEPFSSYPFIAQDVTIKSDQITFRLNPKATFHTGDPIQPADVEASFNYLVQKGHPKYKKRYHGIHVCSALPNQPNDLQTVVFQIPKGLTASQRYLLAYDLGQLPVLSKKFLLTMADQHHWLTANIPASGPYFIESFEPNQHITYKKNPTYWADAFPSQRGLNLINTIKVVIYQNDQTRYLDFIKGVLDVRYEYNTHNWVKGYQENPVIKKRVLPHKFAKPINGIVMNLENKHLKQKSFRQVLDLMFDF